MRKFIALVTALLCLLLPSGCRDASNDEAPNASASTDPSAMTDISKESKLDAIPFRDDQLYAVAYLGYEKIEDLPFYTEHYLYHDELPIHHISEGEYYLIIPRYEDMALRLYENNIQTTERVLVYEEMKSRPFILQCNVSDIFPDATVALATETETVEFSPYISLADGTVEAGDRGLDITRAPQ